MKKKLIVEDLRSVNGNPEHSFRVKKVVNSIKFHVGEILSSYVVESLMTTDPDVLEDSRNWTVELVKKS